MMNKWIGLGVLLSGMVGCLAEPPAQEQEIQQATVQDDRVLIVIVDSATGVPVENMLVCTQNDPSHCDTTNGWGMARLERTDDAVVLTYLGPDYRVHRAPIREESWVERKAIVLPAVSNASVAEVRLDAELAEEPLTGLVLVPNQEGVSASLDPQSGGGPLEGIGDWLLFPNVDRGVTDIIFEGGDGSCAAQLAPHADGVTRVAVESGLVTVVTDVSCY